MSEQIPITPEVLTWARARAGYSVEEARRDFRKIEEWEQENEFPSYPQLEKLAEKYRCPIAVFFFPEPPELEPISESFRTMPQSELDALPREVGVLLRKAKALQLNLSELNDGRNPARNVITKELDTSVEEPVETLASRVRSFLGVDIERQFSWGSVETALDEWRSALTDSGIFSFKDAFKISDYSGFCSYDNEFPIIYVNNSTTKSKQIFTLFHELAHLLFHTSGVDRLEDGYIGKLPDDDRRIEVICNRFAGHFLVPDHEFEREIRGRAADEDTAALLAKKFSVSREVIFRKFLDREWIDPSLYLNASAKWAEQTSRSTSGGNYYYTQIAYLGAPYIRLAFNRFYENKFDEAKLAEYLNVKPENVSKLEETYVQLTA